VKISIIFIYLELSSIDMNLKQGNKYSFQLGKETKEGVFVNELDGFVYVKLKSGYNIGIKKSNIKKTSLLEEKKHKKSKQEKVTEKKGLPKITILHTGGTVASKVDYSTGAVIAQFSEKEILGLFPEIQDIANITSKLIGNMQSEMMRFAHYNILAKAVKKEAENGADGVIITHGTDTMHFTSAALSFALENLGIPVILVGSQRSSDRPSTDAAINLISAAKFIAEAEYAGVAICMHEDTNDETCTIIPGTKAKKFHSSRRDAFKPINSKPIATVNKKVKTISGYEKKDKTRKINLKLFNEDLKIGIIQPHTQMFAEEFLAYKNFNGVVLELLGIGHLPTMKVDAHTEENEKIIDAIKVLCKKMPVVATAQTVFGRIDMNVYTPGKQLLEAGVIGNYSDIHTETAFIKLAWLLSNYKEEEIKELYEKDIRGELSERTEEGEFLNES